METTTATTETTARWEIITLRDPEWNRYTYEITRNSKTVARMADNLFRTNEEALEAARKEYRFLATNVYAGR